MASPAKRDQSATIRGGLAGTFNEFIYNHFRVIVDSRGCVGERNS